MIESRVDFICRQIGFALRDFAVYAVDFESRAVFTRKFFFGRLCAAASLLLRCKRLGRLFGFGLLRAAAAAAAFSAAISASRARRAASSASRSFCCAAFFTGRRLCR